MREVVMSIGIGLFLLGLAVAMLTLGEGKLPPHQPQFESPVVDTVYIRQVDTVRLQPVHYPLQDRDCENFVINRSSWTCR